MATVWFLGCPSEETGAPASGAPLLADVAEAGSSQPPRFSRLSLEVEGQTTSLERRASGWWLIEPVVFPADPVAVDEVLSTLRQGALRERLAAAPDAATLRELGLAPPRLRLMATLQNGRTRVLEAGNERPFDGSIPVRRAGEPEVHAGSGHLRRVLERDADALRAKRLFPFRPEEITQVSVRGAASAWDLERDEQGWRQTQAPSFEADPERVLRLLRRLVATQARAFAPDGAAAREARGLTAPFRAIEVRVKGGAPTRVELSSRAPGPDRAVWVRWQVPEAQPTLAKVDARLVELAGTDPLSLRSTRLLRFDADAVGRVELVDQDGTLLRLERAPLAPGSEAPGERSWAAFAEGEREEVSPVRVAALLWNVSQLRARSPRDPKDDPLRPPADGLHVLRLFDDAGDLLGEVTFGSADPAEPSRIAVRTAAVEAFAAADAVGTLKEATRPEAFGMGQGEDGAEGASSPKKDP